jgi:hypothetical protein
MQSGRTARGMKFSSRSSQQFDFGERNPRVAMETPIMTPEGHYLEVTSGN